MMVYSLLLFIKFNWWWFDVYLLQYVIYVYYWNTWVLYLVSFVHIAVCSCVKLIIRIKLITFHWNVISIRFVCFEFVVWAWLHTRILLFDVQTHYMRYSRIYCIETVKLICVFLISFFLLFRNLFVCLCFFFQFA